MYIPLQRNKLTGGKLTAAGRPHLWTWGWGVQVCMLSYRYPYWVMQRWWCSLSIILSSGGYWHPEDDWDLGQEQLTTRGATTLRPPLCRWKKYIYNIRFFLLFSFLFHFINNHPNKIPAHLHCSNNHIYIHSPRTISLAPLHPSTQLPKQPFLF